MPHSRDGDEHDRCAGVEQSEGEGRCHQGQRPSRRTGVDQEDRSGRRPHPQDGGQGFPDSVPAVASAGRSSPSNAWHTRCAVRA